MGAPAYVAFCSTADRPDPARAVRGPKRQEGGPGVCPVGGAALADALLEEIDGVIVVPSPALTGSGAGVRRRRLALADTRSPLVSTGIEFGAVGAGGADRPEGVPSETPNPDSRSHDL